MYPHQYRPGGQVLDQGPPMPRGQEGSTANFRLVVRCMFCQSLIKNVKKMTSKHFFIDLNREKCRKNTENMVSGARSKSSLISKWHENLDFKDLS